MNKVSDLAASCSPHGSVDKNGMVEIDAKHVSNFVNYANDAQNDTSQLSVNSSVSKANNIRIVTIDWFRITLSN